jgi:hypothetical protein
LDTRKIHIYVRGPKRGSKLLHALDIINNLCLSKIYQRQLEFTEFVPCICEKCTQLISENPITQTTEKNTVHYFPMKKTVGIENLNILNMIDIYTKNQQNKFCCGTYNLEFNIIELLPEYLINKEQKAENAILLFNEYEQDHDKAIP